MENAEMEFLCQICWGQYDRNIRKPKRLHCPHTFCLPCLVKLPKVSNNKKVLCPVCKQSTPVKPNCENLSTDIMLLNVIDYLKCSDCSNISNRLNACEGCSALCCSTCLTQHENKLCNVLKYMRDLEARDPSKLHERASEQKTEWNKLISTNEQKQCCDRSIDELVLALENRRKFVHRVFDRLEKTFDLLDEMIECPNFVSRVREELANGPSVPRILELECARMYELVTLGQAVLKTTPEELELETEALMIQINRLGEELVEKGFQPSEAGQTDGEQGGEHGELEKEKKTSVLTGNEEYKDPETGNYRLMDCWLHDTEPDTAEHYSKKTEVRKIIEGTKLGKFQKLQDLAVCPVTGRLFVADDNSIYELEPENHWKLRHHFKTDVKTIRGLCVSADREIALIGDYSLLGQVLVYSETGEYVTRFGSGGTRDSQIDQPNGLAWFYPSYPTTFYVITDSTRIIGRSAKPNSSLIFFHTPTSSRPNGVAVNGKGDMYITLQNQDLILLQKNVRNGEYPMERVTPLGTGADGRSSLTVDKYQSLLVAAWDQVSQLSYVSVHGKDLDGGDLGRIQSQKYPIRHSSVRIAATGDSIIVADLQANVIYVF